MEVVGQLGYEQAKVADICLLAGVSTRHFYDLFGDKASCFRAAVETRGFGLLAKVGSAFDGVGGPWEVRLRAALEVLLAELARDPATARCLSVELMSGQPVLAPSLQALVDEGRRVFSPPEPLPDLPAWALEAVLLGAVVRPIARYVEEDRTAELPTLVPVLGYFVTLFLLGQEPAARFLGPPPSDGRRNGRSRPATGV